MTVRRCGIALAVALAVARSSAPAQQIPVRDLGPIVATSVDPIRGNVLLRVLPNGSVLATEYLRRRVLFFDSTLTHMTVVVDSSTNSMSSSLIPFGRDSTLFVDLAST